MRLTRSKKVVGLYVAIVLVLLGAFADRAHAVVRGESYAYVSKVQIGTDNYLYIDVLGNFKSTHGCSQPWYARSLYPLSDTRTKAWLQLATASLLSNTPVYIQSNGCTTYGHLIMEALQLDLTY